MNDYELFDLMGRWETNVDLMIIALVVLLSAYLLVAHIAGQNLPRSQVMIITGLMLWFSFMIITNIYASLQALIDMRESASFGYTRMRRETLFKWLVTVGCLLAPFFCVKFMFHVRHPPGLKNRRRPQA